MTRDPVCNAVVALIVAQSARDDAQRALERAQARKCTQDIHAAQARLNRATLAALRAEVAL